MISTADRIKEYELDREIKCKKKIIQAIDDENKRWVMLIELEQLKVKHSELRIKILKQRMEK